METVKRHIADELREISGLSALKPCLSCKKFDEITVENHDGGIGHIAYPKNQKIWFSQVFCCLKARDT